MEKLQIKNRKGQSIVVTIEHPENSARLVFVMHGLGGNKEQPHIQTFANAFREHHFTVVLFDTTNTFGESDGEFSNATITNYFEDLEDVIVWAKTQTWYTQPFALTGHSLGGICTALYAEKYPNNVMLLAPISPIISGKLSLEHRQKYSPEKLKEWRETGWKIYENTTIKKLPWSHMKDRLTYNLLPEANKLTMPVLLIVGENDDSTPPEHIQMLYDAIVGDKKEYHVIKGAPHTFKTQKHLDEIKQIFLNWIDKKVLVKK